MESTLLNYIIIILFFVAFVAVIVISSIGSYLFISSCFVRYAPPVRICGKFRELVWDEVSKYLQEQPSGKKIVDLGSGWGTILIYLAKKFPQHKFVGVERAFTPYWFTKIRSAKLKNVEFVKGNLFEYDLRDVDVSITFLIGFIMKDIEEKYNNELKLGARAYSLRFPLPEKAPDNVISLGNKMETMFIYDIK